MALKCLVGVHTQYQQVKVGKIPTLENYLYHVSLLKQTLMHSMVQKPKPAPKPAPVVEEVEETIVVEDAPVDLEKMTKLELEAVGREHGVELDRREKKSTLLEKKSISRIIQPKVRL